MVKESDDDTVALHSASAASSSARKACLTGPGELQLTTSSCAGKGKTFASGTRLMHVSRVDFRSGRRFCHPFLQPRRSCHAIGAELMRVRHDGEMLLLGHATILGLGLPARAR